MNHFGTQVVELAAHDQTLLFALFAISATHQSRLSGFDDYSGDFYQRRCLNILIPALNDEHAPFSTNLLATGIVLRFFEEMTGVLILISQQKERNPSLTDHRPYRWQGNNVSHVERVPVVENETRGSKPVNALQRSVYCRIAARNFRCQSFTTSI